MDFNWQRCFLWRKNHRNGDWCPPGTGSPWYGTGNSLLVVKHAIHVEVHPRILEIQPLPKLSVFILFFSLDR